MIPIFLLILFLAKDSTQQEENVGTVQLETCANSFLKLEWKDNPFDVAEGVDKDFSFLQSVITLDEEMPDSKTNHNIDPEAPKPITKDSLLLQDFAAMESGKLTLLSGQFKLRLRWSPQMMAAGTIYALLKIQNVINGRPEPDLVPIRNILNKIDNPSFVFKNSVRNSPAYRWIMERAHALNDSFSLYRRDPKYSPASSAEKFAEHRELVISLKKFLGEEEAKEKATEIVDIFKSFRIPMNPLHTLQLMRSLVLKALQLRDNRDNFDVARYKCTLKPDNAGADLAAGTNLKFTLNCQKEEIEDPP